MCCVKELKAQAELEALVMDRIGQMPELGHVKRVFVAGDQTGWRIAAIVRDGHEPKMKQIEQIADELRARYELAA